MTNQKGLFDDLKIVEPKVGEFTVYDKRVSITLTEEQDRLLNDALPSAYPGRGFVDFGRAKNFGRAEIYYESAKIEFKYQRPKCKTLRVIEWLALYQAWRMHKNKNVQIFAGYVAFQIIYFVNLQTLWILADFGAELPPKLEFDLYEEFISTLKNQRAISILFREDQCHAED